MPNYFYTAKNFGGKSKSGFLNAPSRTELAKILKEDGYILIFAQAQEEKSWLKFLVRIFVSKIGGISLKEKINFASNLSVMINAGLPLSRALEILAEQSETRYFKKVILDIKDNINKGKTFNESLALYPEIFNEVFVSMVRVGETAGNLDKVLKLLARQLKRDYDLKSKIRGALIYPAVVIFIMLIVGFLMMWFVVPKVTSIFHDLKVELPMSTKIIIFTSNFILKFWYLIIFVIFSFLIIIGVFQKTIFSSKIFNKMLLIFPIISPIVKKINSARFSRMLSSLLEGGVPLITALEIVSHTLPNYFYKNSINFVIENVKKGKTLNESLAKFSTKNKMFLTEKNLYPPMVIQMIKVGEETGALSELLKKIANFYEKQVADSMRNLSSLIEPILMVIIGATVAFFAVSIIQPIYSISQVF